MDRSKLPKFVKSSTIIGGPKRKKRTIVADTQPGAVDDDAKKRIKKRKNMLEQAGNLTG